MVNVRDGKVFYVLRFLPLTNRMEARRVRHASSGAENFWGNVGFINPAPHA